MGSGSGQQASTTTYKQSPTEEALSKLQLGQAQAFDPMQRQLNQAAGQNVMSLLQGQDLPGYLKSLPYGISEQMTGDIANRAIKDIQPFFGQAGLLDSGVNAAVSARTAGDVRRASAEFNINNLMQLLNIGVGGQAQVQQPALQTQSTLAGLVKGTGTTSTNSSYSYQQPFAQTFGQMGQGFAGFTSPFSYSRGSGFGFNAGGK